MKYSAKDYKGPFLWGAATASHQVEGGNTNNDWWEFEQAGRVKESSGVACDQYHRYKDDFELIAGLGHTAHRFSIEWSRIEPKEGEWNEEAIRHYEDVLLTLKAKGIEPVVTLHHFTNPIWFSDKGGWTQPESVGYFSRYAAKIVERLGTHVRFWTTINEPMVYLYHGFCTGLWPPGHKSFKEAVKVMRHLLKAHVEVYKVIHHHAETVLKRQTWVSIAKHISVFDPCNPRSIKDRFMTWLRDYFFNHLAIRALTSGFLFFPGIFCEFISSRSTLDFIGLNYYTRHFVKAAGDGGPTPLGVDCPEKHHEGQGKEVNVMGWEIYPEGLYRVLMSLKPYHLGVLICENGICAFEDEQRARFVTSHLGAVEKAAENGVKMMGYLYWSLLDNFEWAEGFGPRFGIIEMNYKTQERKIRPSAHVLTDLCRKMGQKSLHAR